MTYDTVYNQVADDLLLSRYRVFFLKTCFIFEFLKVLCVCFICMYVCTTCMPGALGGWKVSDSVELELQMVVSCHVGAWNQTQIPSLFFCFLF